MNKRELRRRIRPHQPQPDAEKPRVQRTPVAPNRGRPIAADIRVAHIQIGDAVWIHAAAERDCLQRAKHDCRHEPGGCHKVGDRCAPHARTVTHMTATSELSRA